MFVCPEMLVHSNNVTINVVSSYLGVLIGTVLHEEGRLWLSGNQKTADSCLWTVDLKQRQIWTPVRSR